MRRKSVRARAQMTESLIQEFLKGEPPNADEKRRWIKTVWFGEVRARAHGAAIKALCQGNDSRGSAATFCPLRKLWGTGSVEQVPVEIRIAAR